MVSRLLRTSDSPDALIRDDHNNLKGESTMTKMLRRFKDSGESGFTLIELLIVVGIIVALAAAIVPQVVDFSDTGTTAQKTTENETVQAAFDLMMAEKGETAVVANTGSGVSGNNAWTALPTGAAGTDVVALYSRYLKDATSTWFYCWDGGGQVTFQQTTKVACTTGN